MVEFGFNLHKLLQQDRVVSVWDAAALNPRCQVPQWRLQMGQVVDTMGQLSAKAQGLPGPITSLSKLVGNPDQRLYLYVDENRAIGLLKVGVKKLFIRNAGGVYKEIDPLCVLDFYVHEAYQRTGIGRSLFEVMLHAERVVPHKLGYDRPSPKLLGFLRKHYQLASYVPQGNNFVVFNAYFDTPAGGPPADNPAADAPRRAPPGGPTGLLGGSAAHRAGGTPPPELAGPGMAGLPARHKNAPGGEYDIITGNPVPGAVANRRRSGRIL